MLNFYNYPIIFSTHLLTPISDTTHMYRQSPILFEINKQLYTTFSLYQSLNREPLDPESDDISMLPF